MSSEPDVQPDFPRKGPRTSACHMSSLTRSDLEQFIGWLTERDDYELSDWQWRVICALGVFADQERTAIVFREAVRRSPHAVVTPATGEVKVMSCSRGGGVCPDQWECACRREAAETAARESLRRATMHVPEGEE